MLLNSSDHTQPNMLIVDRESRAGSRNSYNQVITTPEKQPDPNSITIQPFNKIQQDFDKLMEVMSIEERKINLIKENNRRQNNRDISNAS